MWWKREEPNLKAFFKALILLFPPQIHFLQILKKEKKTPSFQGVISYPHKALYDGLDLKNEISNFQHCHTSKSMEVIAKKKNNDNEKKEEREGKDTFKLSGMGNYPSLHKAA